MPTGATEGHRPATVIDRTRRLLDRLGTDLTVTCFVVAADTLDGTAEVALAGHPAPLVRRPDGSTGLLDAPANVPMGVTTAHACQGREHTLEAGSCLLLYINGLVGWHTEPDACVQTLLGSGGTRSRERLEDLTSRRPRCGRGRCRQQAHPGTAGVSRHHRNRAS